MAEKPNLSDVLKKIQKDYGKSVVTLGVKDLAVDGILSLGSPTFDYCVYGGIPEGRIVEFSGAEGSGKTTTAFMCAASYIKSELARHPLGEKWIDRQGEEHEGPRKIILLDNEGTADPVWAKKLGYDMSLEADVQTIIIRPEGQSAEEIFDMALDLLKTGEIGLLIFDSIATLVPQQIANESMEKQQMGGIAKSLTRFANTAIGLLRKYQATLIAINQVRENIEGYGDPLITPGGRSWKHACSVRLMFKRGTFFDKDGKELQKKDANSPAGHKIEVAVLKTKVCKWDRKSGSMTLNYVNGVDSIQDTITVALYLNLIDNSVQGTYKLMNPNTGEVLLDEDGNEIKIRGSANIRPYFMNHPAQFKQLYDKVYEMITRKEDPFVDALAQLLNAQVADKFGFDVNTVTDEGNI